MEPRGVHLSVATFLLEEVAISDSTTIELCLTLADPTIMCMLTKLSGIGIMCQLISDMRLTIPKIPKYFNT